MKKLGLVLGVAAVAAISGCRDPEFNSGVNSPENEVKTIVPPSSVHSDFRKGPETTPVATTPVATTTPVIATPVPVTPVTVAPAPVTPVTTTPVTTTPVTAGAVATTPVATAPVTAAATAAETITHVVGRGDTLSKISKKYNVKIDAIKKANGLTGDTIRLGQKLTVPAKTGATAAVTASAPVKVAGPLAAASVAAGATKTYVVKGGDTLGGIAHANGTTVRAIKELNGLSKDLIRVGQTLKLPAAKADGKGAVAVASTKPAPVAKVTPVTKVTQPATPVVATSKTAAEAVVAPVAPKNVVTPVVEPVAVPEVTDAKDDGEVEINPDDTKSATQSYQVQEGDDITSVSIAYGVSAAVIRNLNNLGENDQLKVGQVIKIPADQQ